MVAHEVSSWSSPKRPTTPDLKPVYYEPVGGIPFKEVELKYDLHRHDHRVTLYLPEEERDSNITGSVAGYMATDEAYRENAMAMASEGYPSFTIEPANEQSLASFLFHPEHIYDPAAFQSRAVHRALGVALDYTGKEKANLVGHSYGGPITGHAVAHEATSRDIEFALFEGPAAVDLDNVPINHITGVPGMLGDEAAPMVAKYGSAESRQRRKEFLPRQIEHMRHLGRRTRELVYLLDTPDLGPYIEAAHENGVVTGGLFHDEDRFFPGRRMRRAMGKRSLFHVVEFSAGTYHVDAQMRPLENAQLRINVLEKMKQFKLTQKIIERNFQVQPTHLRAVGH